MHYKVYVDRVFFLHFSIQFFLLLLTARLGGYRTAIRRLAAGAAVGGLLFVAVLLLPVPVAEAVDGGTAFLAATLAGSDAAFRAMGVAAGKAVLFAGISLLTLKAALGLRGQKALARAAFFYIAAACLLGGVLGCSAHMLAPVFGEGDRQDKGTGITGSLWGILLPAAMAMAGGLWLIRQENRRRKNPLFTVKLKEGERRIAVTALADSGNSLCDPISGAPVCIAEKSVLEELGLLEKPEKFRLIPYHSIGRAHGILQAWTVEEMILQRQGQEQKRKGILLAASTQQLSAGGRYRLLLHPALLEKTKNTPDSLKETKGAEHDIEGGSAGKDAV